MVKRVLLIVGLLLLSRSLFATAYYVATTGSGSACSVGTPCASIVTGVAKLTVAGDILHVAAGTYTETSGATIPASGTLGNLITIQGDAGAATTIWQRSGSAVNDNGGAISATNKSYIKITGFNFKNIKTQTIIDVLNTTTSSTGWFIDSNTFEGDGNQGNHSCARAGAISGRCGATDGNSNLIYFYGNGVEIDMETATITNNTFTGCYGFNITGDAHGSSISNNTSTAQHSSRNSGAQQEYKFRLLSQTGGCTGCGSNTYANNTLSDSDKDSYVGLVADCGTGAQPCKWQGTGIKFDTGASNNSISGNFIHDINNVSDSNVVLQGIFVESGCNSNDIHDNTLVNIGGAGIKIGSTGTNQNSSNIARNNTIYQCECGISMMNGITITAKNNLISMGSYNAGSAFVIRSDKSPAPHTFKNNLVYDTTATTSNTISTSAAVTECSNSNTSYSSWQSTYGETNSIGPSSDPLLADTVGPVYDFSIGASSPAQNAADDGNDIGAVQSLAPPEPATLTVTFPNGGEVLGIGTTSAVTWSSANLTGNVSVLLSFNNGSTYDVTISSSVAGSAGTTPWSVGVPSCTTCLVKVTSLVDGAVFDASDAAFTKVGINLR